MLISSRHYVDYTHDMFKPFHRGWTRKADFYIVLMNIFECRDMVDFDQVSLADDRDAVAGMLDFRQNVRGEEEGASLGVYLGCHFIKFLLVERVQSTGW